MRRMAVTTLEAGKLANIGYSKDEERERRTTHRIINRRFRRKREKKKKNRRKRRSETMSISPSILVGSTFWRGSEGRREEKEKRK